MKILNRPDLMNYYIQKHNLNDILNEDLLAILTLVEYEPDEQLGFEQGFADNFTILVNGECIAYSITSENKIHCELYYQGMHFMGLIAALWNEPSPNSIRALTTCHCLVFPVSTYREALLSDVKFLRYAVRYLGQHIRMNTRHFESLEVRLADFILHNHSNGELNVNLTVCADLVETSYRHLLRTLQTFCEEGILDRPKKGCYRIADMQALETLAKK